VLAGLGGLEHERGDEPEAGIEKILGRVREEALENRLGGRVEEGGIVLVEAGVVEVDDFGPEFLDIGDETGDVIGRSEIIIGEKGEVFAGSVLAAGDYVTIEFRVPGKAVVAQLGVTLAVGPDEGLGIIRRGVIGNIDLYVVPVRDLGQKRVEGLTEGTLPVVGQNAN
jgi:hypothetical protein